MSYNNNWEQHGVYRVFTGKVTGQEVLQSVQDVEGDPRFDTIKYVINDFLDVKEIDVSSKDIQVVAAIDTAAALSNSDIKIAQVATDPQIEALNLLYSESQGSSPYPTQVFDNIVDARKWVEE